MRWRAVAAVCLACAGCAVGPDFKRPAAPTDKGYTREPLKDAASADGVTERFGLGDPVGGAWWESFGCPALDGVVRDALANNPGLDAARATLRASQYSLRAGYGVFFPQVDAKAGATRQLSNPGPGTPIPSSTYNLFSLSGTVSYALDIWGGERREVEALGAAVEAQRYTLAGAYEMLASNVVDAVIAQAAYRAEIDATKASVALLREQVRIASAQATAGTVPYSNVLTLESQLASTEATLAPLEGKIDQAQDLLAALTGTTPASWTEPRIALSDLKVPERVPVSVPSELVRRRPDILVAEAQLHAANAQIGVATAAMLPSLSLNATFGANNTQAGSLFASNSPFWGIGAGITQPIFQGGALTYQRKAAIETRNAAAAQYRQTVLAAFEQVADTLRGLGHDADALSAQGEAVRTAEKAMFLTQANYQAGIATYLQVLIVDIQYLSTRIAYVQAVAGRLQDSVALFVALGGGWWTVPAASHG